MTPLDLSRKLCPKCGKPMTAVPDDVAPGRPRYVCLVCEDDPLRDPAARKWAAAAGQITFESKSSPAAGLLQRPIVLTTLSKCCCNPNAQLRSIARSGGIAELGGRHVQRR